MAIDVLTLAALIAFIGGASDAWNAQSPTVDTEIQGTLLRSAFVVVVIGALFPLTAAGIVVAANLAGVAVGYGIGEYDDYEG